MLNLSSRNVNWEQLKTFVDERSLSIQELDLGGYYELHAFDGPFELTHTMKKESNPESDSNQYDYEQNYQSGSNKSPVTKTQNQPSSVSSSLRIEGDTWNCPANTATTHYIPLNDDYMIRGAEFQFVNGKAGDYVEVWVTDKDGAVYPAGTQLTKYVNKFCVYEHEPNTQAWVADLVDDDVSDEVPSVFYLEFKYTNAQASGADVKAIVNFWMYKRDS